jgi:hemerythrin-like domain-containing protein
MGKDVVELITQDHREMERLFERLQQGDGDPALLFPQMAAALTAHSRAEEAEVYPEIANAADAAAVIHAREEHAAADDLLAKLTTLDPGSAEFTEMLGKLVTAVSHHIAEEESSTLPALRAGLTPDRLTELAEAFTARRAAELRRGPATRQVGGSELTKEKLYHKAAEHGIAGRSQMSKQQLQEAVKSVEAG